jgi:hypothetical protein
MIRYESKEAVAFVGDAEIGAYHTEPSGKVWAQCLGGESVEHANVQDAMVYMNGQFAEFMDKAGLVFKSQGAPLIGQGLETQAGAAQAMAQACADWLREHMDQSLSGSIDDELEADRAEFLKSDGVVARPWPGKAEAVRSCRVCGCTETTACVHETAGPCWWVEQDLCSHCSIVGPNAGIMEPPKFPPPTASRSPLPIKDGEGEGDPMLQPVDGSEGEDEGGEALDLEEQLDQALDATIEEDCQRVAEAVALSGERIVVLPPGEPEPAKAMGGGVAVDKRPKTGGRVAAPGVAEVHDILRATWSAGVGAAEIIERIRAEVPNAPVQLLDKGRLGIEANKIGLKRPDGWKSGVASSQMVKAAIIATASAPHPIAIAEAPLSSSPLERGEVKIMVTPPPATSMAAAGLSRLAKLHGRRIQELDENAVFTEAGIAAAINKDLGRNDHITEKDVQRILQELSRVSA